uniref:Uncharacterized protein n=1 Tax=Oryza sativa subsp. japonica TaxID=39947 RepID=Q33AF0_ORYSJ|nr:hypothetical protein LOC_Os10g10610 [Oryza sativa Japonica Group]
MRDVDLAPEFLVTGPPTPDWPTRSSPLDEERFREELYRDYDDGSSRNLSSSDGEGGAGQSGIGGPITGNSGGTGQHAAPKYRSTTHPDKEDFSDIEGCHHLYTHLTPTVGYGANTGN